MNTNYTLVETVKNTTNYTKVEFLPEYSEAINIFLKVLMIVTQFNIMVSMGSIITLEEIVNHVKQPISIIIALASQFCALPLCSFGIINIMQLSPASSVSALILACCPGGSISNLFTYYCDGDVSLSTTLTTISTALALGIMPLNLWIYARRWTDNQTLRIPYVGIVTTLALILIPLIIGMLLKKYLSKVAVIVHKIGSVSGMLFCLIFYIVQGILVPGLFAPSEWKSWLLAVAISAGGFFAGIVMSLISRRTCKHVKTIAIETGMQSIALAMTVILTSFPRHLHIEMTPIPTMNSITIFLTGIFLAVSVKISNKYNRKNVKYSIPNEQVISAIAK